MSYPIIAILVFILIIVGLVMAYFSSKVAREEFKKALTLNPEDQVALQGLKSINQ